MKRLILLLLLPVSVMAQKNYTISGNISGLKTPAKVYLSYGEGRDNVYDSSEIKNGKFQFTGSVKMPVVAYLTVAHNNESIPKSANVFERERGDNIGFFLENSPISTTATDFIRKAAITGSVAEKENKELEIATNGYAEAIERIQRRFARQFSGKTPDEAFKEAQKNVNDSIQFLVAEVKDTRRKFVEAHLNTFMGLYVYYWYILDEAFEPAKEEPLFALFSPEMKDSQMGQLTREKLDAGKRRQSGVAATDFTQNDLNGKPFMLSSLKGKYVLVDFWASWCVPCRAENPNLVKAYQQLKDKNFEVVGVSLDSDKAPWMDAVKKDGLPWIHVCDLNGWKNAVAVLYNISSVPQNLLIDPQGMIIARNLRGEDITEKLSAFIK